MVGNFGNWGVGKMVAAIAIIVVTLSSSLRADSIVYDLIYFNVPGYPSPYGSVEVDLHQNSHTAADITFTGFSNSTYAYLLMGNDAADVNLNVTKASDVSVTNLQTSNSYGGFHSASSSWSSKTQNVSQWGTFDLTVSDSAGAASAVTQLKFTVTDTLADWLTAGNVLKPNSSGFLAAAHIAVFPADSVTPSTPAMVTGYAAVPLPTSAAAGTILLVSFGLVTRLRKAAAKPLMP